MFSGGKHGRVSSSLVNHRLSELRPSPHHARKNVAMSVNPNTRIFEKAI